MASAQEARLRDRVVPVGYAIPLSTPVTSFRTIETVRQVLTAANIPFGVEGPALAHLPAVDFATPRVELANLHAVTVGAALDAIARQDSRVRWVEKDGVIDVRLTSGATWLDRAGQPFSTSAATPAKALAALMTAIDPGHARHVMPGGRLDTPLSSFLSLPPQAAPPVLNVSQGRGSAIDGLNALVRSASGSWLVEYDGPTAEAVSASVSLTVNRERVDSPSTKAEIDRADPNLVSVTINDGVEDAILDFERLSRVPIGAEFLQKPRVTPEFEGITLRLDRRQPQAALQQILAYDSRYVLRDEHGMLHVRPSAGLGLAVLDKSVTDFSATNEPFESVLNRAVGRKVTAGVRPAPNPLDAVFQTPISVTPDARTMRELLDALSQSISASWTLRPVDSWALTVTITVSGRALPALTSWRLDEWPAVTAPQPLTIAVPTSIGSLSNDLWLALVQSGTPYGAYLVDTAHTPAEIRAQVDAEARALRLSPRTTAAPELLTALLTNFAGYTSTFDDGIAHVLPRNLQPDALISRRVPPFDFHVANLGQAAEYLLDQILPDKIPILPTRPVQSTAAGPIHVAFAGGSAREALDAVVRTQNAQAWLLTVKDSGDMRTIFVSLCAVGKGCLVAGGGLR